MQKTGELSGGSRLCQDSTEDPEKGTGEVQTHGSPAPSQEAAGSHPGSGARGWRPAAATPGAVRSAPPHGALGPEPHKPSTRPCLSPGGLLLLSPHPGYTEPPTTDPRVLRSPTRPWGGHHTGPDTDGAHDRRSVAVTAASLGWGWGLFRQGDPHGVPLAIVQSESISGNPLLRDPGGRDHCHRRNIGRWDQKWVGKEPT